MQLTGKTRSGRLISTSEPVSLAFDIHEPPYGGNQSERRPIIFLHGLFGSKKNNGSISRILARDLGRLIFALDLRNHGDSPHASPHDYVTMADDVAMFISQQGLTSATLIGHSMGAKTAMTLALKSPHLVDSLVAVDNAPIDAALARDFAKYIQGMKQIQDANITRQADADKILRDYEDALPIRQFLLANLRREQGQRVQKFRIPLEILAKALDHLGDFPFKNPNEVRFEKPTLFIRGSRSNFVPDELIPLIGQFFPRFRMVDIDAGHWLISEKPDAFRTAVVDFLLERE